MVPYPKQGLALPASPGAHGDGSPKFPDQPHNAPAQVFPPDHPVHQGSPRAQVPEQEKYAEKE